MGLMRFSFFAGYFLRLPAVVRRRDSALAAPRWGLCGKIASARMSNQGSYWSQSQVGLAIQRLVGLGFRWRRPGSGLDGAAICRRLRSLCCHFASLWPPFAKALPPFFPPSRPRLPMILTDDSVLDNIFASKIADCADAIVKGLRLIFFVMLLGGCAPIVPATAPPQLEHTPGAFVAVADNFFDAGRFRVDYPKSWRVVKTSIAAADHLQVVFAAPDSSAVTLTQADAAGDDTSGERFVVLDNGVVLQVRIQPADDGAAFAAMDQGLIMIHPAHHRRAVHAPGARR